MERQDRERQKEEEGYCVKDSERRRDSLENRGAAREVFAEGVNQSM